MISSKPYLTFRNAFKKISSYLPEQVGQIAHKTEQYIKDFTIGGNLFENMIVADVLKTKFNQGVDPRMFFWRDNSGLEIDLIIVSRS